MTSVLEADLPVQGGVARVQINAALHTAEWHARLRIASPTVVEPPALRSVQGDVVRWDFVVSRSLHGKPYEVELYGDAQPVVVARGTAVEALGVLELPQTLAELEGGTAASPQYVHVQDVPASTWTVVHPLGGWPPVTIVDSSLREVEGDVTYIDESTIHLDFSAPFGGRAFIGG